MDSSLSVRYPSQWGYSLFFREISAEEQQQALGWVVQVGPSRLRSEQVSYSMGYLSRYWAS